MVHKGANLCGLAVYKVRIFNLGWGCEEAIWIKQLYKELGFAKLGPMDIYCDNQSMIKISNNLVYHSKTKYSKYI